MRALPLENGFKTVRTGSIEHDALVAGGYVVVEHDDVHTILRLGRRADDRPKAATNADLQQYRMLEREVWEQIAAEFQAVHVHVEASQLEWAMAEFKRRVFKETGRYQVNGRIR
jgi:hypothetical protein